MYGGSASTENWWIIVGRSNSALISYDGVTWRPHLFLRPDLTKIANLNIQN
jgi:hypothetical protein